MPSMTASRDRRTIGVIGGHGPLATVSFLNMIYGLQDVAAEQDYVRVLVDCNPDLPDRDTLTSEDELACRVGLANTAAALEKAGADLLAMPCNTLHEFEQPIREAIGIQFISITGETARVAGARRFARAGILATRRCLAASLYQRALSRFDVEPIVLCEESVAKFMDLLAALKTGRRGTAESTRMRNLTAELAEAGAEVVIAGCTEIALVPGASEVGVPVIDSTLVLARRTLSAALGEQDGNEADVTILP